MAVSLGQLRKLTQNLPDDALLGLVIDAEDAPPLVLERVSLSATGWVNLHVAEPLDEEDEAEEEDELDPDNPPVH